MLEDGSKLLWIAKDDLKKMCIQADLMIHEGKDYHTMPSVAASTVMYIEYLKEED